MKSLNGSRQKISIEDMPRKIIAFLVLFFILLLLMIQVNTNFIENLSIESVGSHSSANFNVNDLNYAVGYNLTAVGSIFAFYYPWYGTPNVSGYWRHWNDENHDPNNFIDGRRDIAAKHYPLIDVYDSNDEEVIKRHIKMAKIAGIECFIVSWWGPYSFEDYALRHIMNVAEQSDFKITICYETTSTVQKTIEDILYVLNQYGNSSCWYTINGRPVIFVYSRARDQLNPTLYWDIYGNTAYWSLSEDVRKPPHYGIFVIEPYKDGIGYVQSGWISLPANDTYTLKLAISDVRNDCPPYSDVGFRIKVRNLTQDWQILDDLIVNFNEGWLDLSYDISSYAGQTISIRVESYDGGVLKWASEWAAVDYICIINSKGEIINKAPYFDNEWKTVISSLNGYGYDPFFIFDFEGYEQKVQDFADYFLNFTDGLHTYNICKLSLSEVSQIYKNASMIARSKGKVFIATVMPGYDDTAIRSPGYVVDRQNGTYYKSLWFIAVSTSPNGYVITSFNEWHEGTEIEPSLEYGYMYIDLTRVGYVLTRAGRIMEFLRSQFNPQLGLCSEAPNVAPNSYWLVSDNLWALKAFEMFNDSEISSAIRAKLIELANIYHLPVDKEGLPISYAHETVLGNTVELPFRTPISYTLFSNNYSLKTVIYNGTIMNDWQEYADLLLYAALSSHWQGNETQARYYFESATKMWDGIGLNDTVTQTEGMYSTYKLALLLYTSKILNETLPFEFNLLKRLLNQQRESDGGIVTHYLADGTPIGDANIETSAITAISILVSPWPYLHEIELFNLTILERIPKVGEPVHIQITIRNNGYFTETFTLYLNYTRLYDPLIGAQAVTLALGESVILNFIWIPEMTGRYEITAYTSEILSDAKPQNNILKVYTYVYRQTTSYGGFSKNLNLLK